MRIKFIKWIEMKIKAIKATIADITDLKRLSYDIPTLKTKEICTQNDFYYHAYWLKKFCGLPADYVLKCALEHGPGLSTYIWEDDYKHEFPAIVVCAAEQIKNFNKVTDKKIYSIGPYIAYVKGFMNSKVIEREKQRLGKNLLVFPYHSTHHVQAIYDAELFCKEIQKIKEEHKFDTVRVCLYWKDILNNKHKEYQKYGFECVSAGHIYNKNFLPRLKSIIETSTVTMSNNLGSHVWYSLFLNKPHYLYKQDVSSSHSELVEKQENELSNAVNLAKNFIDNTKKAFEHYSEEISAQQKELLEQFAGVSAIKTKDELRNIFKEMEDMYKKH